MTTKQQIKAALTARRSAAAASQEAMQAYWQNPSAETWQAVREASVAFQLAFKAHRLLTGENR